MEVHAHSHTDPAHGGTSRKKLKHYLFEFLMLFLAVFCGFLAENFREHQVEHQREKQFIVSMIEDLSSDTANLAETIKNYDQKELKIDTVLRMYRKLTIGYNDTLRRNFYTMRGFPDFIYTDRTMQQLKNSGSMRLIRNKQAADGIVGYDSKVRDLGIDVDALEEVFVQVEHLWYEIFDEEDLLLDKKSKSIPELEKGDKNYLLKNDKATLGKLNNEIIDFRDLCAMVKKQEEELKQKAITLIVLLKKEYHLK